MFELRMYLGKMLVDRSRIEFDGMITCTERQEHEEQLAQAMHLKNISKIDQSMLDPEFIVTGFGSKMEWMTDKQIYELLKEEIK